MEGEYLNAGGMTPTIVNGSSFRRIVCPIASARPPKRRCHALSVRSATCDAPMSPSSDRNVRPIAGIGASWLAEEWAAVGLDFTSRGRRVDEAIDVCRDNDMRVVAGACPLMFMEPVGWFHRAHRVVRRLNGSMAKSEKS